MTSFAQLPDEIISQILRNLDLVNQRRSRRVCAKWKRILESSQNSSSAILDCDVRRTIYCGRALVFTPRIFSLKSITVIGGKKYPEKTETVLEDFVRFLGEMAPPPVFRRCHPTPDGKIDITLRDLTIGADLLQNLRGWRCRLTLKNITIVLGWNWDWRWGWGRFEIDKWKLTDHVSFLVTFAKAVISGSEGMSPDLIPFNAPEEARRRFELASRKLPFEVTQLVSDICPKWNAQEAQQMKETMQKILVQVLEEHMVDLKMMRVMDQLFPLPLEMEEDHKDRILQYDFLGLDKISQYVIEQWINGSAESWYFRYHRPSFW